jgi:hypothetical protein
MNWRIWILVIFCLGLEGRINAQTVPAGFPAIEEFARRKNLLGESLKENSFALRPVKISVHQLFEIPTQDDSTLIKKEEKVQLEVLPFLNSTIYNSNRPYGWGNSSLFNSAGWQNLVSGGIFFKFSLLEIQLRPEWVSSQNKAYQGYGGPFSDNTNFSRFRFWNFGDHPENFGEKYQQFGTWGQSYISLNFWKTEVGFSTQNIWWGPGQFTSLIFSNNARGIKHLFLKTSSPVNIGIGHLEGQVIAGRAEDSGLPPSQNKTLNEQYFWNFSGDWRYVTGISLTYNPKFLKNFFVGFSRTFQQYNNGVEKTFQGRFPIFEAFQKERFFEAGNSMIYDALEQDQQVAVFFKFRSAKGKFELYSEFGKHDHNFNWRDFILNPEHARAYLFGFSKLVSLPKPNEFLQFRGEVIQQSESNNRYIRYPVLGVSNTSWHTHYQVRGFSNYGESMGVGVGVGSNAQILEISKVKNRNKMGLILQRIENHQDFYFRAFSQDGSQRPWIDLSAGILWDIQRENIVISSSAHMVYGKNYQWKNTKIPTADFNSGSNLFSFSGQVHLIYLFKND